MSDFFTQETLDECNEGTWDPEKRIFRNNEELANE